MSNKIKYFKDKMLGQSCLTMQLQYGINIYFRRNLRIYTQFKNIITYGKKALLLFLMEVVFIFLDAIFNPF